MALKKSNPVLAAMNIPKLVAFYEEKLGFERGWCDEGYGIVKRDEIAIHFWHCDNKIFPENTSCYVFVDAIEQLYEEYQATGVIHPNGKLEDKPWGVREFAILDLYGNLIRFGEPLVQDKA